MTWSWAVGDGATGTGTGTGTGPDRAPAPGVGPDGRLPGDGPVPVPVAYRLLSDEQITIMAIASWVGAMIAPAVPLLGAATVVVWSLVVRSRWALIVGVALVAAATGQQADQAYQPIDGGEFEGEVTAVTDARSFGPGQRVEVALDDGRRVEASGFGSVGAALAPVSAGDRVVVAGRLRGINGGAWFRSRHLVGRLAVDEVGDVVPGGGPRRVVEGFRAAVGSGATSLSPDQRALYLGLVLGDDRAQTLAQRARFRAAGLTHLLAVSGQNVAFVLAVVRPGVMMLPRRGRLLATVVILAVFAAATRFEPSVLRATVTAGLASWALVGGHRQSGVRLLGLATTALIIIDPFLVHSVGFQLSVAASAGILMISPLLADRLPGPKALSNPMAVTVGAQLGVLPLLLFHFGTVSLASIPANLLAGWAAGLVMMWGLTGGLVAGVAPPWAEGLLLMPTRGLLGWLDGVAAWAARLPSPLINWRLALVATALLIVNRLLTPEWAARPLRRPQGAPGQGEGRLAGCRWAGCRWARGPRGAGVGWFMVVRLVVLGSLVAASAATVPTPPAEPTVLAGGGRWFPADGGHPSILIVDVDADVSLIDSIVQGRLTSMDIVIAQSGAGRGAELTRAITEVAVTGIVYGPSLHRIVGATRVTDDTIVEAATAAIVITTGPSRLSVEIVARVGAPP